MKRKIKIAIAGFGVVGKRRKHFINKNPNMQVVAVSDIAFKKQKSFRRGIEYFKNYKELFNLDIDALFVCLPNRYAPEVTILGIKNGLHVFCEKPPGRTVKDIKNVIKVEKKYSHIKLKYGFNHRYHDSVIRLKKIIDSKKYGMIINFRGVYGKSKIIPFSPSDWRSKKSEAGGGILLDQGIHMLDLILNLSDDFNEVKSFVSNSFWNYDVEDNAYAIMKSKKGIIAMLHSTATQWQHKFRLEISLERALIELSGILSSSKSYGEEKIKIIEKSKKRSKKHAKTILENYTEDLSWSREINEFCDSIIKNKKIINGNSRDALRVMELIYKIYNSDPSWKR